MPRRLPQRLLAITPGRAEGRADTGPLVQRVGRALEAGLPALLVREPGLGDREFTALAAELVELVRRFEGRWIGVHDRVHVALEVEADGVHLGFRSLSPASAREIVGDACAIGFSAHARDASTEWESADYLTFGPLNATPSKKAWLEPTGLAGLRRAVERARCPIFALGGVKPADVAPVIEAGATGVSVLSGLLAASDVAAATASYLAAFPPSAEASA